MLEAKVPLIIVQFQQDDFCNAPRYPYWYGKILQAVEAGRAETGFFFLNLEGTHDCGEKLATYSRCEDYGDDLRNVWQSVWQGLVGRA